MSQQSTLLDKAVDKAAGNRQNGRSARVYNLSSTTLSSGLRIQDSSNRGDLAAELDLSVLKRYGTWRHCGHDVEIRPVGIMRKQETVVEDALNLGPDKDITSPIGRRERATLPGTRAAAVQHRSMH
ncbi:hypothetical protein X797_010526 [Metarhizium robertsii]|uniref:Uncharacterized protein n=1 Tax=Metarhizium robertsii TaxID=568076 RepID=A0A014PKM6_9HYPO|nr:hypothetical protein X797_010526 [Metarhizium robertsii]